MMSFEFKPATKEQAKGRVALVGPPGSGKTYTALSLATAFAEGGSVAIIDTERGSASKYSDEFTFHTLNLSRCDPTALVEALNTAAAAGFDTVVVDSLSHFWSGSGGMLEQADARAKGNSSFSGWKEVRPMEREMIDTLTGYPGHVIACLRSKVAYDIQSTERGKKEPVKLGQRPDQREGIEYEFDIVGDMADGTMTVTKSRARAITGAVVHHPGADIAADIMGWLKAGVQSPQATAYRDRVLASEATAAQLRELHAEVKQRGLLSAVVADPEDESKTVALGLLISRTGRRLAKAETEKGDDSVAA